jgi:hypothetical protein
MREWRKAQKEQLHDGYFPPNINGMINPKKNWVGWACGMCGRQMRCIPGSGGETRKKETTWKTYA